MEASRNPIGMRQTTGRESLQLLLYVIFHASDRWTRPIQQQVGGAAIAVIRKTNAAGVGYKPFSNLWTWNTANVGAMNVPVDRNRLTERSINRVQFSIGRFWCRSSPRALGTGVHQRHRTLNLNARQPAQPRDPFFSQHAAGCRRHLTDGRPEGGRGRRLTRKLLQRLGPEKHFICV